MNPYFLLGAAIAVALAFGSGYYKGNEAGQAEVQQQWDKEKTAQFAEHVKAQAVARQREQELQANADKLRTEKDARIRELNARATALSNSLRDRAARPSADASAVSSASGAGSGGCTGRELFKEDGEFLVGIAREADELRVALKQCYAQYQTLIGK